MVSFLRTAVAANGRELSHNKSVTRNSETEAENMESVFSRYSMVNVDAYLLSFSILGLVFGMCTVYN